MKAAFNLKPYFGAAVSVTLIIVLTGILLRVFERAISDDFSYVWNGFWLIGITISTVGYGDIVPKTHIGRVLCTIAAILGLYSISYAVNAVQTSFSITEESELSISGSMAYRQKLTGSTKKMASILIQRWWRLCIKRKNNAPRIGQLSRFIQHLYKFIGFRTRSLKLQDPTLQDIVGSIEKESNRVLTKLFKHLESLDSSKSEVKSPQSNKLKLIAYSFENNSSKYANTLKLVMSKVFPRRESHSFTSAPDHFQTRRRQGFSQKRATIVKTSSQAMKTMMRRLNTRIARTGTTPTNDYSPSIGEFASTSLGVSPESKSPLIMMSTVYNEMEGLNLDQD